MAFAGKREPKESFLTHQGPHLYGQCHGLIVRVWMNNDLQVEVSNCLGIFFCLLFCCCCLPFFFLSFIIPGLLEVGWTAASIVHF